MYLNLDKLLIVVWLVYARGRLEWSRDLARWTGNGFVAGLATAAVCISCGWLAGVIEWDRRWPQGSWIWTLNNLVLVCFTEEILFCGFIQGGLAQAWGQWRHGSTMALVVGAARFGFSR